MIPLFSEEDGHAGSAEMFVDEEKDILTLVMPNAVAEMPLSPAVRALVASSNCRTVKPFAASLFYLSVLETLRGLKSLNAFPLRNERKVWDLVVG